MPLRRQEATSDSAAARCRMNEVTALVRSPGKLGIDGPQVETLHGAGDLAAIRHYWETDVLNTYLIYLHWACHTGLPQRGSPLTHDELAAHLTVEGEPRPHLAEVLAAWRPKR